jgi:hypothetical protein
MDALTLLADAFGRINEEVHNTVDDLKGDDLTYRIDESNSIAWLIWHLTRVQDDHLAGVIDQPQLWTEDSWMHRFDLDLPEGSIGYGHSDEEVGKVVVTDPALLTGYHDAVHEATLRQLKEWKAGDLDKIVDKRWDPPVTLAVRLVSVLSDCLQHVGQAAYLKGLLPA